MLILYDRKCVTTFPEKSIFGLKLVGQNNTSYFQIDFPGKLLLEYLRLLNLVMIKLYFNWFQSHSLEEC